MDEFIACSEIGAVYLLLLRSDIGNEFGVGCLAFFRQGGGMNGVDGGSTSNAIVISALRELSKLACIGCIPGVAGGSAE